MGAAEENIINTLIESMQATEKKPKAYDTGATITRIEGSTAWVHIPGGVDETPVKLTIDAKVGDEVQVRVSDGQAFLVGNATSPPTDDTVAEQAVEEITKVSKTVNVAAEKADAAARIAGNTNQYFWHTATGTDTGAHITEKPREEFLADPDNGGGNLLARSNGIALRDGLTELATLQQSGMDINTHDSGGNLVNIAHLGYGLGNAQSGTGYAPYYTLGTRKSGSSVGNLSTAEGIDVEASAFASHAEGNTTTASGEAAHAQNTKTVAGYFCQTAIGFYNDNTQGNLFEIGNGNGEGEESNALTVDWSGNVEAAGDVTDGSGNVLSALAAILSGAILVTSKQVVSSSMTIQSGGALSTLTVACDAISGYTPVLATPRNPGHNVGHFRILYLDGTDIKVSIGNASASAITISSAYVNVLYVKSELVGSQAQTLSVSQDPSTGVLSIS